MWTDSKLQCDKITNILPGDIAIQLKNLLKLINSKKPMEVNMPFALWLKSEETSDPGKAKLNVIPMMFMDVNDIFHWMALREYLGFAIDSIDKQIEKMKR